MTAALAILIVLLVVVFVVSPLITGADDGHFDVAQTSGELWNREKAVAVLAITEADFDRATGKLSDADYRVLRTDYEGRALQAMDEIEKTSVAPSVPAPTSGTAVRFCSACGSRFSDVDAFCGGCGQARRAA